MGGGDRCRVSAGYSLVEAVAVLAILVVAGGAAVAVYGDLVESRSLRGAARTVKGDLQYARTLAVARREVVRIRLREDELVVYDSRDRELRRARLMDAGPMRLDSVRLRPGTLRFNSKGQAGPGSVYLYRGRRSVRIVINFLGRMREE